MKDRNDPTNRPGVTRQNADRNDIKHCWAGQDHAPHPNGIYWCPGGPSAGPGGTLLPPEPDTRTEAQKAQASRG